MNFYSCLLKQRQLRLRINCSLIACSYFGKFWIFVGKIFLFEIWLGADEYIRNCNNMPATNFPNIIQLINYLHSKRESLHVWREAKKNHLVPIPSNKARAVDGKTNLANCDAVHRSGWKAKKTCNTKLRRTSWTVANFSGSRCLIWCYIQ